MIRRVFKILFILFWMGLIFYFSMDNGTQSTAKSDGLIIQVSEFLFHRKLTPKEKQQYTDKYQIYVRKTAHFTVYFCLGFSFLWFLQDFHSLTRKDVLFTILFVFLYACSDEFHQLFVQERSGQFTDVLLDTLGGTTSTLVFYGISSIGKKHKIRHIIH